MDQYFDNKFILSVLFQEKMKLKVKLTSSGKENEQQETNVFNYKTKLS